MRLNRRSFLFLLSSGILSGASDLPSVLAKSSPTQPVIAGAAPGFPWSQVCNIARDFVNAESPDQIWPFELPNTSQLAAYRRKVFVHYFTPFPLSFDNKPVDADYYCQQYLRRSGENNKFAQVGGYLRERPISPGAFANEHWQAINTTIDVLRAHRIGADGFGVDLQQLGSGRYWDAATALFSAALATKTDFKILIEPDTDILRGTNPQDLTTSLLALGEHPAAFRLGDGRLLLAPFAPEEQSVVFWEQLMEGLKQAGLPTAFMPIFNNPYVRAKEFAPICYGMSEWGSRDPVQVGKDGAAKMCRQLLGDNAIWMSPIAPPGPAPQIINLLGKLQY